MYICTNLSVHCWKFPTPASHIFLSHVQASSMYFCLLCNLTCKTICFAHIWTWIFHAIISGLFITVFFWYVRSIQRILKYPPTRTLSGDERQLLWKFRFSLMSEKKALTKFLRCVEWSDVQVRIAQFKYALFFPLIIWFNFVALNFYCMYWIWHARFFGYN